jgi:hypothetical protein
MTMEKQGPNAHQRAGIWRVVIIVGLIALALYLFQVFVRS